MGEIGTIDQFLAQVQELGGGTSQFDLRNENKQKRQFAARFPKVKKEKEKKAKLLVQMEIALPFDPQTGEVSEQFNRDRKWRPPMSASKVAKYLKLMAKENEKLKVALMKPSGVETWDPATTEITEADLAVFRPFLFTRTYSIPRVVTNLPGLMRNGYNINFMVNIVRDENDELVLEPGQKKPLIIAAGEFYAAIASEEIKDYQKKIDSGEIHDDENTQRSQRATIRQKAGVGTDGPMNLYQVVEIPLNQTLEIETSKFNVGAIDGAELKKNIKVISPSENFGAALDRYASGTWKKYDKFIDFKEVDMTCGKEDDDQLLAKNTQFSIPTNSISELPKEAQQHFIDTFVEANEMLKDVEAMAMRSSYLIKYDEEQEERLLLALIPEVERIVGDPNGFCTQAVLRAHKDFIMEVLGEKADDLYIEMEAGVSDRAEGSYIADKDGKEMRAEAKEDLMAQMTSDTLDENFDEELPTEVHTEEVEM